METFKSKKDMTIVPFVKDGDCLQWYAGKQYDDDVANAKKILAELDTYYPGAKSYEVAGILCGRATRTCATQRMPLCMRRTSST
jgi:hypothetical protein